MHLVVGCEDAEPAVARVVSVSDNGSLEVQVLPGPVAAHRVLVQDLG